MNLADTLRGLWRRWYIVIPGMLITATLAVGAWSMIQPGYERSSTQLLIPGALSMPEGANPYLFLGGLTPAADVLVRAVGSENALNDVVEDYPEVEIAISRDTSTEGPVILIDVTASSDTAAKKVLGLLVGRTAIVLNELQEAEKILAENRMTLLPITVDSQSVLDQRSRFIAVAATGLAGMALTLFLAALVDGLSGQRKRSGQVGEEEGGSRSPKPGRERREEPDLDSVLSPGMAKPPTPIDPSSYDSEPASSPVPTSR